MFEVLYLLIASCDDNTDWKELDCSHNLQRMVGSLWHVAASRWHNVLLSTALCAVSDPAAGSECYPAWTFMGPVILVDPGEAVLVRGQLLKLEDGKILELLEGPKKKKCVHPTRVAGLCKTCPRRKGKLSR